MASDGGSSLLFFASYKYQGQSRAEQRPKPQAEPVIQWALSTSKIVAMRTSSSLLVAAALVFAVVVVAETLPAAEATYRPIGNTSNLVVQQVGRFSVLVYDLSHRKSLVFVSVVSGETEAAVGGGTNYRLVILAETTPGGSKAKFQCVVWGVPGSRANTWKLLSFKAI